MPPKGKLLFISLASGINIRGDQMEKPKERNKIKFSVACNWDSHLLEGLQKKNCVYELYGKISGVVGGGRAFCEVPDKSKNYAKDYIQSAKKSGLSFNYLLNATILEGQEFESEGKKKILGEVEWIAKSGAETVTVAIPFLAKLIKAYFPELQVEASVFAHISNLKKLKKWQEECNIDGVCLDRGLTRKFEILEEIRKNTNLRLKILANDPCISECPNELYHDDLMSIYSLPDKSKDYVHYCSFNCLNQFVNKPDEIVRSTFIRPEDVSTYEGLGIDILKIVDRNKPTEWILNAVDAYEKRKYEGNLADILSLFSAYGLKDSVGKIGEADIKTKEQLNSIWRKMGSILGLYINNRELNGFLEYFKTHDCDKADCNVTCNYCELQAKKAIKFDAQGLAQYNLNLIQKWFIERSK